MSSVLQQNAMPPNNELEEMRLELKRSHAERILLTVEVAQLTAERNQLLDEVRRLSQTIESLPSPADLAALRDQMAVARTNYESERATRIAMQQSRSWRITAPMRRLLDSGKAT